MATGFGQRLWDRRVLRAPVGDAALAVALTAVGLAETAFGSLRWLDQWRGEPAMNAALADLPSLISHVAGTGVEVKLQTVGTARKLPAAIELSAYRIVQEGITNALKHATAGHIAVTVRYADHDLEIEVADDGAGGESSPGSRRGLAGIGERVAVFGGDFCAGPQERGGWSLRARLPVTR